MVDLSEKLQKLNVLVEQFCKNMDRYKTLDYKEARVRTDFIDKFFTILDWDINNEKGDTEDFRDVVIEDNLEIQGAQKAPDYSFRVGGSRVFFVEAKKPSVNLKDSIDPAFQVRRYGYTAKLPVSILTDFEEFAIYDTSLKPNKNDKSTFARLFYCRFDEYEKHFEFIYNTFSKGAVKKGSIKEYIQGAGIKKGVSTVDKEFLKLIEEWRSHLAKNIALRNLKLDIEQLNLAVQKIIDRIIFLRIAEDKEIEMYENLFSISKETKAYQSLVAYFEKANRKYNSELFKKDQLIDELKVDNEVLIDIIQNLYYPESPYAFSVLPVEILGNIYEQFLGKTIRLTAGHQAKIEEKPEVRKAGGVYYTPQYIVEYIVANTVGEKIKNKSPEEIEKITVVDPACGSGSFLLGAYTYLLNYHLKYYNQKEHLTKALKNNRIYQHGERSYRLTIQEKQQILLNNIYGVDIDKQATEVTKLSLMLRLLENENNESAGQLFKQTELRLLPTLSNNIKCGNSLIGPDFYKDKNLDLFGKEDMNKLNVFDWDKEFPEIFKNGGFDCVIGNPPYIFGRELITQEGKNYFYDKYKSTQFKINTYFLFVEKGNYLLNHTGLLGYIIPNNWLSIPMASDFRYQLLTEVYNIKIINSLDKVFEDANIDTCILLFCKQGKKIVNTFEMKNNEIISISKDTNEKYLSTPNYIFNYKSQDSKNSLNFDSKIISRTIELGSIAEVRNGVLAYEVGAGNPKQTKQIRDERLYHSQIKLDESWIKYVEGVDVKRYFIGWGLQFIKYGKNLSRPRDSALFNGERILVRQIPAQPPYSILACLVEENLINDNNSMIIKLYDNGKYNIKYILAIINSRLISNWFLYTFGKLQRKIFPQFKVNELSIFPIKTIDFSIASEKAQHDKIVLLVDQISAIQKLLYQNTKENDKNVLQQKQRIIDNQIDQIVYELYGLTPEEIKIVEGNTK